MVLSALLAGCDPAYRYVFYPPTRLEYTLAPDPDLLYLANDTSYSISRDSLAVIFDRKSYKVEVKYMSDYQLNNFEFPEESKDAEFSGNPFTFANWVDPQIGLTPNRFTVFKVSIYNYASSKLNFDPEASFLVTDRGDIFPGYGREEKSSRNQSLENYFKRRKGSTGVDDEIFERRMGIIRQTVLYLGRPVYQGDSREGLVVYDPLHESVDKVKLVVKNFILSYDENNEPGEFIDLQFFFKRIALVKERLGSPGVTADTLLVARGRVQRGENSVSSFANAAVELHQVQYRFEGEQAGGNQDDWNIRSNALSSLARFLKDSLKINTVTKRTPILSQNLADAQIVFLFAGSLKPIFGDIDFAALVNVIKRGGFLFVDNSAFSSRYEYFPMMQQLLEGIGAKLGGQVRSAPVPNDHRIYHAWRTLAGPPQGSDDIENMPERRDFLQGLFLRNKLVAVASSKGYSMIWEQGNRSNLDQYVLGANVVAYVLESSKAP